MPGSIGPEERRNFISDFFNNICKNDPEKKRDWEERARYKINRCRSYGYRIDVTPEDLVQEIISETILLKLTWDYENLCIHTYINNQVKSKLSNMMSMDKKFASNVVQFKDDENDQVVDIFLTLPVCTKESIEKEQDDKDLVERCRLFLKASEDELLLLMFDEILSGKCDKQISDALNLSFEIVRNKRRKVRELLKVFLDSLGIK